MGVVATNWNRYFKRKVNRTRFALIWTILALLCIVLGFVGEFIDEKILIGTLEWFVVAIAFNT